MMVTDPWDGWWWNVMDGGRFCKPGLPDKPGRDTDKQDRQTGRPVDEWTDISTYLGRT